jgi:tetratricopeptide (TPR) repeat protein
MRLNWDSLLPAEEDPDFWDMASREARCREAVLHNRTDPVSGHSARHLYGDLLSESGLFHGALDYFLLCEKEEPPDAHLCALIGHTLAILDDPQAALERMTRALEIDPHFVLGATYLIAMLDRTGAHAEAGRELERISDDLGETLTRAARMTGLHWRGETEALKDLVTELESDPGVSPFFKGIGRVMLEDDGAAIAWFEQGYRGRDMFVRQLREKIPFYLGPGPWERLMGRQRFRILLRTLNLDDAWRDLHRHRANLLTPVTGIHVSD